MINMYRYNCFKEVCYFVYVVFVYWFSVHLIKLLVYVLIIIIYNNNNNNNNNLYL